MTKESNSLQGGGYEAPAIAVIDIRIEKGFAQSYGDGGDGTDDYGWPGGYGDGGDGI